MNNKFTRVRLTQYENEFCTLTEFYLTTFNFYNLLETTSDYFILKECAKYAK